MKWLLCLDLDGTVLDDQKKTSKELVEILERFKEKGNFVAINTIRNFNRVEKFLSLIKPDYINCLSGSLVKKSNGYELFNQCIPMQELKKVFQVCAEFQELELVCSEWEDVELVVDQEYAVKNNKKFVNKDEIQNLKSYKLIYLFKGDINARLQELLKGCDVSVSISHKNKYVRIMPKRDKWDGIKLILDDIEEKDIQVISFGNDSSDSLTLKNSNIGVAMINSEKELLKHAKYVTKFSNNENGVTKFLEELDF